MQQYTGKEFLPGFGSSGELDPGEIAEKIYGDRFDYGHACAYLLRRFGFHFEAYDDYKTLASWILTTPMDGVYLWIMIKGHSCTSCCFGVRFSKEIYKKFRALQRMPYLTRVADAQRFAFENGYPFAVPKPKWNRRDKHALCAWESGRNLLSKTKDDFSKEEFDEIRNQFFEDMEARQNQAYDDLEKSGWISPAEASLKDFCSEVSEALHQSLEDLLRPVHVRDCYINLLGEINDNDLPCSKCELAEDDDCPGHSCEKFAQPHKYAGMGVLAFAKTFNEDNEKEQ